MEDYLFQEIQESDLPTILELYNYFIKNTTVTFHKEPLTLDEIKKFVYINHSKYKSYLIKKENEICGYCLYTQYKNRQAYDRTAEVTIYLKEEYQGKGIAVKAVNFLEIEAKKNDIKVFLAVISGDNFSSIKLFEKLNYFKCAHYKDVGEKFGKILDVVAYEKIL